MALVFWISSDCGYVVFFFFKQKTAYEMRISDWSSDVCSSDLFTTRQNLQYHWIKLEDAPDILAELATVEMHAIQTSGESIRNISADQYAGAEIGRAHV